MSSRKTRTIKKLTDPTTKQTSPTQEGPFYRDTSSDALPPIYEYQDFVTYVQPDEIDPFPRLNKFGDDGWQAMATIRTGLEPSGIAAANGQPMMRRVFAFLMRRDVGTTYKYEYAGLTDIALPGQAYDAVERMNKLGSEGWMLVVPPNRTEQQGTIKGPDGNPVIVSVFGYFVMRRKDSRYPQLSTVTVEQEEEATA